MRDLRKTLQSSAMKKVAIGFLVADAVGAFAVHQQLGQPVVNDLDPSTLPRPSLAYEHENASVDTNFSHLPSPNAQQPARLATKEPRPKFLPVPTFTETMSDDDVAGAAPVRTHSKQETTRIAIATPRRAHALLPIESPKHLDAKYHPAYAEFETGAKVTKLSSELANTQPADIVTKPTRQLPQPEFGQTPTLDTISHDMGQLGSPQMAPEPRPTSSLDGPGTHSQGELPALKAPNEPAAIGTSSIIDAAKAPSDSNQTDAVAPGLESQSS